VLPPTFSNSFHPCLGAPLIQAPFILLCPYIRLLKLIINTYLPSNSDTHADNHYHPLTSRQVIQPDANLCPPRTRFRRHPLEPRQMYTRCCSPVSPTSSPSACTFSSNISIRTPVLRLHVIIVVFCSPLCSPPCGRGDILFRFALLFVTYPVMFYGVEPHNCVFD
jgi:hypothetical protein